MNINIECVDNAGSAQVTCGSDGRWGPENPVCKCRLGYEDRATGCVGIGLRPLDILFVGYSFIPYLKACPAGQ